MDLTGTGRAAETRPRDTILSQHVRWPGLVAHVLSFKPQGSLVDDELRRTGFRRPGSSRRHVGWNRDYNMGMDRISRVSSDRVSSGVSVTGLST